MPVRFPYYSPVADGDCFTKHEFMGVTWWKWLENLRHFEATRTRILVNDMAMQEAMVGGGLAETASFVFDRTPQCDVLLVRCMFESVAGPNQPFQLSWRADTDDIGGGSASTGYVDSLSARSGRGNMPENAKWNDVLPVRYPSATVMNRSFWQSPWIEHIPASGATYAGTTLKIMTTATNAGLGGLDPKAWLRGVCVVGAQGLDAT